VPKLNSVVYFSILVPYADVRFSRSRVPRRLFGGNTAASAASTGVLDLLFDLRVDISDVEFDAAVFSNICIYQHCLSYTHKNQLWNQFTIYSLFPSPISHSSVSGVGEADELEVREKERERKKERERERDF
jgi:hypothetical protein